MLAVARAVIGVAAFAGLREGEIRVSGELEREYKVVAEAWRGEAQRSKKLMS